MRREKNKIRADKRGLKYIEVVDGTGRHTLYYNHRESAETCTRRGITIEHSSRGTLSTRFINSFAGFLPHGDILGTYSMS